MNLNELPILSKHPDVRLLLDDITAGLQSVLGQKLVGLYLYGSLVAGDFDYEISDIDLLAATETAVDGNELESLRKMHAELVKGRPAWDNRIETAYVSLEALQTFKLRGSRIANISPGEPLHFLEAGRDWLLNWYFVRERSVTLRGAPPETIIAPVSKEEFIEAVRGQARERAETIDGCKHSRPYQAYLIMTVCRALYASQRGEQVSKRRAASWTALRFPGDAALIESAFEWRAKHRDKNINHEATFAQTKEFVCRIVDLIADK
ncbi:MAG TPA: aminoglycoside adenylyltransferase domain-containing protein [Pyrinomonadaceae bacterium]|jgi:hypothetical protein